MIKVSFKKLIGQGSLAADVAIPVDGVTALFGPSGSGKTTFLRVLAGLENIAGAQVQFGRNIWQCEKKFVATQHRNVGVVFQQPSLFEHLTVKQNIEFPLSLGVAKQKQTNIDIAPLIDIFELGPLFDRRPETLSGGEQQRVAIVRALVAQPDILLMDEPLASLDQALKVRFMGYLQALLEQIGIPVVYVTHSIDELTRLSDRVVLTQDQPINTCHDTGMLLTDLSHSLATTDHARSRLVGQIIAHDKAMHVSQIRTPAGDLWLHTLSKAIGQRQSIVIHAKDVSIAIDKPQKTSILNILPAEIMAYKDDEAGSTLIKMRVGSSELIAQITQKSFQSLGLKIGQQVYAQIKSAALS